MKHNMTLIVLAGGVGKRFWPLTTSKALFPFFGSPLFAHTIGDVPEAVSQMIIVTNPANDAAVRSFRFPIPTSTVVQKEPKGMGNAILAARDGITGPVLIVNVDDVVDPELLSRVVNTKAFGAVPGWKPDRHLEAGYLAIENGRVQGIAEKPKEADRPSPYANIVCHYIADAGEFIAELATTAGGTDDVYERALTKLMARREFQFVPYDGHFAPLKYPWNVLDALAIFLDTMPAHKGKNVWIGKNVIIDGPVFLEDNVKIFENTKIVGPCYIGKNTVIGNNNIIRESHIGADCVTGFSTDITRSYVGDTCWFHENYIGDSVLEGNISMGGGAKLANLRLDDGQIGRSGRTKLGAVIAAGVRIGINASVMPGVKIGKNTFVGSGVVLDKDMPENSFCIAKPGYVVRKNTKTAPARKPFV